MTLGSITIIPPNSESRLWLLFSTPEDVVAAQTVIRQTYHNNPDAIIFILQGNNAYKISSNLAMSFTAHEVDQDAVTRRIQDMEDELKSQGSITITDYSSDWALAGTG